MAVPPATIGPYRVRELLGQGGDGTVYLADDDAGRSVALKTVRVPRREMLEGIRREVHALSRIRHPGIARIVDHGVTDAGIPWYAMEVVESRTTLRDLAAPERALALLHRLCAPLAFLHGEGIVHRDLKPENVLVRAGDLPLLVDLGMAATSGPREVLQESGMTMGTLAYISPEQIRGELVDPRADLYALGCMLHEVLSGAPPFVATGAAALLEMHQSAPAPQLQGVPRELARLTAALLAKRPEERPGHASDVARVLAPFVPPSAAEAEPSPRPYLYRPALVAREATGALLDELVARARRGHGAVTLLAGESGSGKTRLAMQALRESRRRGMRTVAGECREGSAPGGGLDAPLTALLDHCRDRGPGESARLLGERAAVLAPVAPGVRSLPGIAAAEAPELGAVEAHLRLVDALARTLLAFAAKKPLLVVLDDLHAADQLTLEVLATIAASVELASTGLLVIGAHRPEEAGPPLDLLRSAVVEIPLPRLDGSGVRAMVGGMLALREPPPELAERCWAASEGNPLFVGELLRQAMESGLITRDPDGVWQLAVGAQGDTLLAALELPRGILDIVARRLAGLPGPVADLAGRAAVVGRSVPPDLLAAVVEGSVAADDLYERISELLRRHVLEEDGESGYRFCHDRLREAAYASMDPGVRTVLHRRLAGLLQMRAQPPLAELGRHWEASGEPALAGASLLAAARQARQRFAHADAEPLYHGAIRLLEEARARAAPAGGDLSRLDARLELAGEVLYVRGKLREGAREAEGAREEARRARDRRREASALRLLGQLHGALGELGTARERYAEGLALARELDDASLEGAIHGGLALALTDAGELVAARAAYELAMASHRAAGDRALEGSSHGNMAVLLKNHGFLDESERHYESALQIAREIGNRPHEGVVLGGLAVVLQDRGEIARALATSREALAIHREVGNLRFEAIALLNMSTLEHGLGDAAGAEACCRAARDMLRRVGDTRVQGIASLNLAQFASARDLDGCRQHFEDARSAFRAVGNRSLVAQSLVRQARIERRAGSIDRAADLLDAADAEVPPEGAELLASLACARGHLALARGGDGERYLDAAVAHAATLGATPPRLLGDALGRLRRAIEARARGDALVHGEIDEGDAPPRSS